MGPRANFGGPKIRISPRKSVFHFGTPIFVNGAFVGLEVTIVLGLDPSPNCFSFPSYGRFPGPTPLRVLAEFTPSHIGSVKSSLRLKALLAQRAGPFGPRSLRERALITKFTTSSIAIYGYIALGWAPGLIFGPKWPFLGPKTSFWPWNPFFWGCLQKLFVPPRRVADGTTFW